MADSFEEKTAAEIRRGVLQVAVLAHLREPAYGYDLLRVLHDRGMAVEEGTLYPVLRRMEKAELLKSHWDTTGKRPRKYYTTTEPGIVAMHTLLEEWNRIGEALRGIVADSGNQDERGIQEQSA